MHTTARRGLSIAVVAGAWALGCLSGERGPAAADDAGTGPGGTVVTATCSERAQRTETNMAGEATTSALWFARAAAPIEPSSVGHVSAWLCDREVLGMDYEVPSCPTGSTCMGVARLPAARCTETTVSANTGELLVGCGYEVTQFGGARRGYRWTNVRFVIE